MSGTGVTLTATPATGWSFDSWVGVDIEVGPEATVTMNSNGLSRPISQRILCTMT